MRNYCIMFVLCMSFILCFICCSYLFVYADIISSGNYYSDDSKKVFEEEYISIVHEYNKIINSNLYTDYISSIIKNKCISIQEKAKYLLKNKYLDEKKRQSLNTIIKKTNFILSVVNNEINLLLNLKNKYSKINSINEVRKCINDIKNTDILIKDLLNEMNILKYQCIKEGQYLLTKYNYKDEVYSFFKENILSNYQYSCPYKTKKIDIDTYEIFVNNIHENTDEYILESGLHLYTKEFCINDTYIKKRLFYNINIIVSKDDFDVSILIGR